MSSQPSIIWLTRTKIFEPAGGWGFKGFFGDSKDHAAWLAGIPPAKRTSAVAASAFASGVLKVDTTTFRTFPAIPLSPWPEKRRKRIEADGEVSGQKW
jgi:hypothetical protein